MASEWVSVSEAAAAFGVSARAIQKRAARGTLAARKVERGGASVWEVDGRGLGEHPGKAAGANSSPDGREPRTEAANLTPKVDASAEAPHAQNGREPGANMDANREADYRAEISFLRGLIEQRDRDAAELRAALRKALEATPRALTAGASPTVGDAPSVHAVKPGQTGSQNAAMGNGGAIASKGPKKAAESSGAGVSYGSIADALEADWIEKEMNR